MNPSPCILPFKGKTPEISSDAWLAPNATVVGEVTIAAGASVWFGAIVRGDVAPIVIETDVNIQDGAVIHATLGHSVSVIRRRASIGHNAIVHGATIESEALIGMGAIVLDNAVVGKGSVVAAGSVVLAGTVIPPGELWAGSPAISKGPLKEKLAEVARTTADHYLNYAEGFRSSSRQIERADN